MDALQLATLFHETYERRAPDFGYETRQETRRFDPSTPNGRLMVAVCGEILAAMQPKLRHTLSEDFSHFLSYSGFYAEPPEIIAKLRLAFEAAWEPAP